jgi:hypothetical protein
MSTCSTLDCERPTRARGLCSAHYQRARAHGMPVVQPQGRTPIERFWAYITKPDGENGCWLWQGALDKDGYGAFSPAGKGTVRIHRWAYEQMVGQIPDGLVLDHLCERRNCANPQHLRPTTVRENVLRSATSPTAVNARKTHCPNDHPLSGDNLIVVAGSRLCRICERARWKRNNDKRKVSHAEG